MNILIHDLMTLDIPLIEKIIRPIIVYLFLIVALRLSGKREIAQLNPFDLVVLLTISNTVQNAIIGNDNSLLGGLVGAATLLVMNYVVVRFLYSSPKIDAIIEGAPSKLMEHGQLNQKKLKEELITVQELESAARKQGFASLDDVEEAVLEPGGSLSFIKAASIQGETEIQKIWVLLNEVNERLKQIQINPK